MEIKTESPTISRVLAGDHVGDLTRESDLQHIAGLMKELGDALDSLSKSKALLQSAYDHVRITLIPGMMDEAGIRSVTFDGVGRVSLTGDAHVHVPAGARQELQDWLTMMGFDDLIQQTVNASTLKAWAIRRLKAGEDVPEVIKISPFTRAAITKI